MAKGDSRSSAPILDTERVVVVPLTIVESVPVYGIVADKSGT